jgi:molecular chaperone DnaK
LEQLLIETRKALKENAPIDRIRELTSDLNQAANVFNAPSGTERQSHGNKPGPNPEGPDDVIDAEFTEK